MSWLCLLVFDLAIGIGVYMNNHFCTVFSLKLLYYVNTYQDMLYSHVKQCNNGKIILHYHLITQSFHQLQLR